MKQNRSLTALQLCRSFVAELTIKAQKAGKNIYAREHGSNKQSASKACSLSIVRQLYHIGEIEKCGTQVSRKKASEAIQPFPVKVPMDLQARLDKVITDLSLRPVELPAQTGSAEVPANINLITNYAITDFEPKARQMGGNTIPWAPPLPNWNCWTACNIDEGPEAFMKMDEISVRLGELEQRAQAMNPASMRQSRENLPAFQYRSTILETISRSPVTLIRGATGCGKTTQVQLVHSYSNSSTSSICVFTSLRRVHLLRTHTRKVCMHEK